MAKSLLIKDKFKPGEWIIADDEFAHIECVVPIYYEQYDAETNENEHVGNYKHTLISYHTFCTTAGKICSSVVQTKFLDFCDWLRPLTSEESEMLNKYIDRKAKAYDKWCSKCKESVETVTLYADIEKGKSKTTLSKLRKVVKTLPETFTFKELLSVITTIPEINAVSTENSTDEYISFNLSYKLKEQKSKELTFCKIGSFEREYPEDLSLMLTFESVFIALYQLTVLYGKEHPSEELQNLVTILKEAAMALFNQDFKNNPLAKDYYRNAPKVMYTPDLAYSTITDFLSRNAKSMGVEFYADLLKNKNEDIVRIFNELLQDN